MSAPPEPEIENASPSKRAPVWPAKSEIPELSKSLIEKLTFAGYESADDVLDASKDELLKLKGFGKKTLEKILGILNSYYEEESQDEVESLDKNQKILDSKEESAK